MSPLKRLVSNTTEKKIYFSALLTHVVLLEMKTVAVLELLPQLMPGKLKSAVASKHVFDVREERFSKNC